MDDHLIERLENTRLKLHEPVSGGVVLRNDKPWEGPANFGMSVIEVDGRLLMYYRGWSLTDAADQNGVGCVAESRDGGATWTKPVLNLVAKPQWPDNNIIATADGEPRFAFPCAPWVDTRPGVPAAERIKMIQSEPVSGEKHTAMRDPAGPKRLVFWASADGFTFRKLDPQPEMISDLRNCFDGGNTMFWSEVEQQYVLYYRWYDDEWGRGRRTHGPRHFERPDDLDAVGAHDLWRHAARAVLHQQYPAVLPRPASLHRARRPLHGGAPGDHRRRRRRPSASRASDRTCISRTVPTPCC